MKRKLENIFKFIINIILLWLTMFTIDYTRAYFDKRPIFCVRYGIYSDGGTTEYLGLGYKVIDFNIIWGYDGVEIGPWSMQLKDFDEKCNDENKRPQLKAIGYLYQPNIWIRGNDYENIKNILESLNYNKEPIFKYDSKVVDNSLEVIPSSYSYTIKIKNGSSYCIQPHSKAVIKDNKKKADISIQDLIIIENIMQNYSKKYNIKIDINNELDTENNFESEPDNTNPEIFITSNTESNTNKSNENEILITADNSKKIK